MNEQANKILVELLQKASNGIDAAVSFSQAQIPEVIHQLLVWNMVHSLIMTLIAISTIPLVFWFVKRQCRKVEVGKFDNEGYSWDRGNPKYSPTMVWDSKGELSFLIVPGAAVLLFWGLWVIVVVTKMTWLKILLAPKLYLIEYAATLIK
ncbi:hypothetical protein AB2W86_003440 [Salmonella enterica]|uniref:hypothetical protein n=1 Tax=Salmonella enterica TaxID=28901 RepID=UPI0003EB2C11|nr:hypothetical protein [Salmonella enterica]EAA3915811.1 hypothetical protein [Salmonella enterica subsp. enterica serovar Kedougou]EBX8877486.1 hypothetical protein [Salmonella enterica subsp. enterica serovar Cubana]EAC1260948.1 hypothetical protein [Salmonella enterica subsp. enterica serovar Kedougou]EAO6995701.1 hypothetical protein [Salmonella enterica]EAT2352680.1 hypothetical protein [Salmonella enterica]